MADDGFMVNGLAIGESVTVTRSENGQYFISRVGSPITDAQVERAIEAALNVAIGPCNTRKQFERRLAAKPDIEKVVRAALEATRSE